MEYGDIEFAKATVREYMDSCMFTKVTQLNDEDIDFLALENQIGIAEMRGILLSMA